MSFWLRPIAAPFRRRALTTIAIAAALTLSLLLAERSELSGEMRGSGVPAGDGESGRDVVEAEIVVVRGDRSRVYSSSQLPPDGRVVFARFAARREETEGREPPTAIASWIFRVVPDADEIRITVRDRSGEPRRECYEYRREAFVAS